jgi:hypothetical protein
MGLKQCKCIRHTLRGGRMRCLPLPAIILSQGVVYGAKKDVSCTTSRGARRASAEVCRRQGSVALAIGKAQQWRKAVG